MFSSERAIDVCGLPQSASGRRTDGGAVCRGVRGMPYGAGEGGGGVPTEPEAELLAVSHGEEHAATAFDLYGSPDPSLWEDSLNGFAGGEGGGDTVELERGVVAGGFGFVSGGERVVDAGCGEGRGASSGENPVRWRLFARGVNSSGQLLRQGWGEDDSCCDDDAGCYRGSGDVSGAELPIGLF